MPPGKKGLAFGGSGSGRSKISSLKVSGADNQRAADGKGKGYKKKKLLNRNFINNGGNGAQGGASSIDTAASVQREKEQDDLDRNCGFHLFSEGPEKLGWLLNFNTCSIEDKDTGQLCSAVACYFTCQSGEMFKCKLQYSPYFYLQVKDDRELEVEAYLRRKFEGLIKAVSIVYREDLDLKNHLAGHQRKLMKIEFDSTQALMEVRGELTPSINRNRANAKRSDAYSVLSSLSSSSTSVATAADAMTAVEDIKEYDVPFHIRYAIDAGIRVGNWYTVTATEGTVTVTPRPDLIFRAEPRVCAFDIETTKLPLHFPNAEHDQVFMISYMLDRQGYLIVNRAVVGGDIEPFEYTPKPEFPGPFHIFNEADEKATLQRWFTHMGQVQPSIYVTYNGDFFDWPFIEARAAHHGLDMHASTGFRTQKNGECLSKSAVHMDCLCWVNRDSYLPQGSRGLKAVTKAKLGYDPVEVDPEEMVPLAQTKPQAMASYSVSDAVATYYLYMTYIHPFIFSLATIIPMPPDDVLRKGSGTLCEHLLMVEAYRSNVVCPNKHRDAEERFYKGRLLESETYIGGKVEAIESGVFRSDIPLHFNMQPEGYQYLIDRLDKDLRYGLEVECGADMHDLEDYETVKASIQSVLEDLRDRPIRDEKPLIYHLDVAAMYPNIILTNRLQPSAIVTDAQCAACDYNRPGKQCLRPMEWVWRGETYMIKQSEYSLLRGQLEMEKFPSEEEGAPPILGRDLPTERKGTLLTDRIKRYAQRVYKRVSAKPETAVKVAGVCQRENGFYVDTVLAFRDRRYEYKGLVKKWKKALATAEANGDKAAIVEAGDMIVLYDSLQLAHKCILNSFYGYVMRKGARWYSMEMAGVTTYTGAQIIKRACDLVTRIGRPLELDTDGIWCCLPGCFPEEFSFTANSGKLHRVNYPGLILNVICAEHNTNDQYHTLTTAPDGSRSYEVSSKMSIEFEVDGPYLAMILPASKEEGKLIKKRYAVFNPDGSLAELKGFEIKRRGELKLIKVFQSEVFDHFLLGQTLQQCYESVAGVANRWLDLLDTRGMDLKDAELIEYLSESSVMSKTVEEYGARKSSAITTARRLAQFLGDGRLKDKGLVCNYITACKPRDAPTSERAIPVIIFSAAPAVARAFLRRWTGEAAAGDMHEPPDVREFLDWDYYRGRLSSAIQKIITIPAAYQKIENPVPRVAHPDWLHRSFAAAASSHKQRLISSMFTANPAKRRPAGAVEEVDMEDIPSAKDGAAAARVHAKKHRLDSDEEDAAEASDQEGADGVANPDALEDDVAVESSDDNANENIPTGNIPEDSDQGAANHGGQKQATLGGMVARRPQGPSMQSDYRAWVKARKAVWRQHRMALRALGAGGGAAGGADMGTLGGLGGGLQKQVAAVMHATWHIIQVEPTNKPGVLDVWALIDTSMHKMTLQVPRTLYVDVAAGSMHVLEGSARFASGIKKVARTLPDGSAAEALLQVELSEEDFIKDHASIARMLGAPHIRGCYESRTPAYLSALEHLSCTARVADRSLSAPPAAWSLSHLFRHPSHAPSYLSGDVAAPAVAQPPSAAAAPAAAATGAAARARRKLTDGALGLLKYVIIVMLEADRGGRGGRAGAGRGVWAAVLPAAKKVIIIVLQRDNMAPRELVSVTAEEMWAEVSAEAEEAATGPTLKNAADYAVEVAYVRDAASARTHLASDLAVFRASHRGPMLALLATQSPAAAAAVRRAAPALRGMPCCSAPLPDAEDIAGVFAERQGIPWQDAAPRVALEVAAGVPAWLQERAALARYTGVPLCNLEGDEDAAHHSAMDVGLARTLRSANHLLWVEDPSLPDVVPAHQRAADSAVPGPDPISLDNPGAYRCYCVELQPQFLLLDAVLQADDLAQAEGSLAMHTHGGRSLAALRSLLLTWATDASSRGNKVADDLIRRVHAWMLSPSSPLYSPLLLAVVHTALTKVFLQLLAELRALDATIVSASPASIVVSTRKHNKAAARAYVSFLVDTVSQRSLFQWVNLRPCRAFATLLWRDAFNYSGIQVPVDTFADPENPHMPAKALRDTPAASSDAEEDAEGVPGGDEGEEGMVYVSEWNIREWLPQAVHRYFDDIVERFVTKPYGVIQEEAASQGGTQAMVRATTLESRMREFLAKWLPQRLLDRLFDMTQAIHHRVLPGASNPAFQFKRPPGSHLPEGSLGTAALAFVRTICHVLALDASCQDEVAAIRRQLLTMLHVREFAEEAQWVDPCRPLVLPAVPCSACFAVTALDVTRTSTGPRTWCCPACTAAYSVPQLEAALMDRLKGAAVAGTVCDLQCARCRGMSRGGAACVCGDCGGALVFARDGGQLQMEARVIESIAEYHGLELLREAASWMVNS